MDEGSRRTLDRLEAKLDDTADHLSKIDVTLTAQHISLKDHIERTNILQEIVLKVNRKVTLAEGALMLIGAVATVAGAYEGIRALMGK